MSKSHIVMLAMAATFLAGTAKAADLQWTGKNCFVLDSNFNVCKPDDKWDTQKTDEALRPVKLVYHKSGANPVIWLVYDNAADAKSMDDYVGKVRSRFESRGIRVDSVLQETINGKKVYIVTGADPAKDSRFSAALFWRKGMGRALQVEYTAASNDFSTYQPQFMATVSSIKDMR